MLRVGARMHRLTLALASTAVLLQACGNDPAMPARADAMAPGGGNTGGSGGGSGGTAGTGGTSGSGGTSGGTGGRGGSAGSGTGGAGGSGDARGPDLPARGDASTGQDMNSVPPASGIKPPMFPPPGMGSCAAGCPALRAEYADAVLRAQRCSAGAQNACAYKAPGSLGCGGCGVWVSDVSEIAPIANRFNELGCYGCFFDGAGGEKRCHAISCPDLEIAMCAPQGTCINMAKDRTCAPGVMTGARCTNQPDYCIGGGHTACYCSTNSPNWTCF
jgi:hypothetical protein